MKKLLIILPLLFACKSSKNTDCDAYGQTFIEKDTIVLTTEHINYGNQCSEDTTMVTYLTDPFNLNNEK
jgi:hypothetical protein